MVQRFALSPDGQLRPAVPYHAVLDATPEPVFDDITRLAAGICEAPIALVTFTDQQRHWCKSQFGLRDFEIPPDGSFCSRTMLERRTLVVTDAKADERFKTLSIVAGAPHIRFYAGVPLLMADGTVLGTLCVMDTRPRIPTELLRYAIEVFARQVVGQLELRHKTLVLEQQAQLLRAIVDAEPEMVKLVDRSGRLLMINRAGAQMVGARSPEQLIGQDLAPLVHAEYLDGYRALFENVFNGQRQVLQFEATVLDGRVRWFEAHAVPLRDGSGSDGALLAISRDITDQKRAEAAVRESEAKFRMLFEQATDGILIGDADGRILDANPAACAITGYSRAALLSMTARDLVAPHEVPRVGPEIARLSSGATVTTMWELQRRDGRSALVEVSAKQLSDGRLQAFVRDVTARHAAEAALRESEARLRQAVRAGRVGIFDWDLTTGAVFYSPEWKRQLGYEDDEIGDSYEEWERRVHPDDLPAVLHRQQRLLRSDDQECEVEYRLRHRDGSYRQILSKIAKLVDEHGRAVRVVGAHVDITDRAELQAQLLQAQKMESIGRLAGGIAHDFNNLLTVINGLADTVLSELPGPAALRDDLQQIRLAGEKASLLTRQLLTLGRQQVQHPELLDLGAVVRDMQYMLQRLVGEQVRLVLTCENGAGQVRADRQQIEQIVLNLAANARDAMPDGGTFTLEIRDVEIDEAAAAAAGLTPHRYTMLKASDTGIGMDDAVRRRVFEPFFTTKPPGQGTGLGLSTTYGIVTQNGGSISVASEPGRGTTFTILLPRVDGSALDEAPAAETAPAAGGTETILVVEDERPVLDLTRRILQSAGYRVLAAASGEEALAVLARHEGAVHLMLTDLVMPGMNGRELAAQVARTYPKTRVLFMSGYTPARGRKGSRVMRPC